MNVVAVQLDMAWEDKPANHRHVRELLADAAPPPGALIVLPEMFDTGFSMNAQATAQSSQRESEAFLRSLAAEWQSAVLGGVVGEMIEGMASNEAVGFAPDGEELTRYRKMQLFTPSGEHRRYSFGESHSLMHWAGMTIAPYICYDLRFPEIFRPAATAGAELFCVIASWPAMRSEHWVRLLQARAIENQAYVLGVNRCGEDPQLSYDGRTCLFNPLGEPLGELDAAEQVAQWEVSDAEVGQWREKFPALQDIRNR